MESGLQELEEEFSGTVRDVPSDWPSVSFKTGALLLECPLSTVIRLKDIFH